MLYLYRVSLWIYSVLIRAMVPFYPRALRFIRARENLFSELEAEFKPTKDSVIWVHAASLGEFEQGRPVIESIRREFPNERILLTFFSPSGYEVRKDYALVDHVHYLPLDSPKNARKFLNITNPKLALFIKYEFWIFYLLELRDRSIPVIIVSAIFRSNQLFFHPVGKFYARVLASVNHFFVQDERSAKLLGDIGINQVTVSGDTRYDRVIELASQKESNEWVEKFIDKEKVMMLGSIWPSDMECILPLLEKYQRQVKFIVVPHQTDRESISKLNLNGVVCLSEVDANGLINSRILVIDEMGLLASLYRYADFAIVGGASRGALHNVLEPAVYGVPVFFGAHPSNDKFVEARGLLKAGGAFTFTSAEELEAKWMILQEDEAYCKASKAAEEFVKAGAGATKKVMKLIRTLL